MNLEEDLTNFLSSGKELEYEFSKAEPGKIGLCSLDELSQGVVWVTPLEGDGYFEIPAVSITNKCDAYDPDFLLLWLPNEKVYGSWDCDHWILTIFPNTSWQDIVKSPLKYVNAQWYPNETIGCNFLPESYELKEGMLF